MMKSVDVLVVGVVVMVMMAKGLDAAVSISHLVRRPERPVPKVMPCGTRKEMETDEEIVIESLNYSKKKQYPNSHVCEWNFNFEGKSARFNCPHFHLTEFLCLDHVQVTDGLTVQNHYCGNEGPRDLLLLNKATVRFYTSAFFPGVGFSCSLSVLEHHEDEREIMPSRPASHCTCGSGNPGTKVVNGTITKPGEVPWQAGLVRTNETVPFCGGSLINDRYVLTAAHCVVGRTPYNLEVILNADKMSVDHEGFTPDRHSVAAIVVHRNYTASLDYDAALLRLDPPVDLTKTSPICLPTDPLEQYIDTLATVTGWGYTMEDGELSANLRKAFVLVMSQEECRSKYSKVTDRMMCAAAPGTDACQGDSGGPLFFMSNSDRKQNTQIAIVSWGIGCARPDRPGVYTRLTEILRWIRRRAEDGSYCQDGPLNPYISNNVNSKNK